MHHGTLDSIRTQQGGAKQYIRELTDGGESEAPFEIIFADGEKRSHDHGEGGHDAEHQAQAQGCHEIDPENVAHDAHESEHAGLDHCHSMQ